MSAFLKKNFKILSLFLILSMVLSFSLVKAYEAPLSVQIMRHEVAYNDYVAGNTYTKNTLGIAQSVYNSTNFTSLTNLCENCKIGIKLMTGNEQRSMIVTQMGNTYAFPASSYEGDYYLKMARYDFTLLNTFVYGTWNINK